MILENKLVLPTLEYTDNLPKHSIATIVNHKVVIKCTGNYFISKDAYEKYNNLSHPSDFNFAHREVSIFMLRRMGGWAFAKLITQVSLHLRSIVELQLKRVHFRINGDSRLPSTSQMYVFLNRFE